MTFLIILFLVVILLCNVDYFASWNVHREMNIESGNAYGYVSFERFLKEFDAYNEIYNLETCIDRNFGSIFVYGANHRNVVHIHADLIEFEGKNMIIIWRDWGKFKKWRSNFITKPPTPSLWN